MQLSCNIVLTYPFFMPEKPIIKISSGVDFRGLTIVNEKKNLFNRMILPSYMKAMRDFSNLDPVQLSGHSQLFRQPFVARPVEGSADYEESFALSRSWRMALTDFKETSKPSEDLFWSVVAHTAYVQGITDKGIRDDIVSMRQGVSEDLIAILVERGYNPNENPVQNATNAGDLIGRWIDVIEIAREVWEGKESVDNRLPIWFGPVDEKLAHAAEIPFLHGHGNGLCEATVGQWYQYVKSYNPISI